MRARNDITTRVLMAIALIVVFTGCADRDDPTNVPIAAHPDSWVEPGGEEFHGEYIAAVLHANADVDEDEQRTGVEGCASCHGADLGKAMGEQCYACHARGEVELGGHPAAEVFLAPSAEGFHGELVIEEMGVEDCRTCHGLELAGGWAGIGCNACHPGPSGHPEPNVWLAPANAGFHGEAVIEDGGVERCESCHGDGGSGGWAELSCTPCHAGGVSGHPETGAGAWHPAAVVDRGVNECMQCHGSNLDGGWTGASCVDCHASLGG